MPVPVDGLKRLLQSDRPGAALVLVEGSYVVADREEVAAGALPVVTREELLERLGGRSITERDLDEVAATLSSAVDNRGG
ncbi:hypothetical protein [Lentzea nigeriaca]|uniref:hypothetical protein n=1 Tax=Lentzea nigeriaca TaxID=1128665 RepID=UPI00195DE8CC|nr:hypothetical protein [Lentzea nigeriaca]MBM7860656.1 hypothetical protein [Lentzea nigeriaca]